jgi:hypothetical protein
MIPMTITDEITALRRLERRLRLVWGVGAFAALSVLVLVVFCWIDWRLDLREETPGSLRVSMLLAQIGLWAVAGYFLVLRPWWARLGDDDLALWVERRLPVLNQRLISAVQLNRPGADTRGMSNELIGAMTGEAERYIAASRLLDLPDRTRLHWGLGLIGGVVLFIALHWLLLGQVFPILIGRQFLATLPIPRGVEISHRNRVVQPVGEPVRLYFEALSKQTLEGVDGHVCVQAEGRPEETYPLVPARTVVGRDWHLHYYAAEIPPGATPIRYRARLGDGRSGWGEVTYEPRPEITRVEAWVLLPAYAGVRPDGQRYVQPQPRGDVVGVPGARAVVRFLVSKPETHVGVRTYSRPAQSLLATMPTACHDLYLGLAAVSTQLAAQALAAQAVRQLEADETAARDGFGPELHSRYFAPKWDEPPDSVEFDLRAEETAYRIHAYDAYYFSNLRPPRRSITVIPDEPPQVQLLPERFDPQGAEGLSEDVEVTNMPLPVGEAVQVGYYCRDALGLDRAELRYRVNDGPWRRLALREVTGTPRHGPFDPRRGLFANSHEREQVYFHAVPSANAELVPGRLEGGGRFDFQTRGIPGLKLGDTLEYFVEVYDKNPQMERAPGRSEIRKKKIVTEQQFKEWVWQTLQHEKRLRSLEQKQRGVFDRKGPGK